MRPFRGAASLLALAVLVAADGPAQAAWNNVFQVSCFHRKRVAVANYAPCCPTPVVAAAPACPCPCPCPQPVCTTQYVQRSYYEPVTTYVQRTYYEPVTTYQTSYYCEAVCSYRYVCCFDPCTCSYQQVAQPVISHQLRARCNAVTSYLQRCQMVPVQSYKLSCRLEPVTTCCTPACPTTPCCNGGTPSVGAVPSVPNGAQPGVGEQQQQPVVPVQPLPTQKPSVGEQVNPGGTGFRRFPETSPPPMPGADGSSYRQPRPPVNSPPPQVRIERIASLSNHTLEGQVVDARRAPQAGARLLFVSADADGRRQSSTADSEGQFRATLAAGSWLVYIRNREGTPVFQAKVEVNENQPRSVTLVSR